MRVSFRQRLFLGLLGLGTVPLAAALVVLTLQVRASDGTAGLRSSLDEIAGSAGEVVGIIDTVGLSDDARAALARHTETIADRTALARRAETLSGAATGLLFASALIAAALLVAASVLIARRWAGEVSAPVDELVAWIGSIKNRQPLPPHDRDGGAPEFGALRGALRRMADDLEQARARELERERLMAFRETARRVAHEIRGPITSSRLALAQLTRAEADGAHATSLDVLESEIDRLDRMAREFSAFGRLPEGPEAPVDLVAVVRAVTNGAVPADVALDLQVAEAVTIDGHYEPLRRAVQNLVRNAVETGAGRLLVAVRNQETPPAVIVSVSDNGPGIPADDRDRIFAPYFTTKRGGTGLGLAMVKQTVEAHGGRISHEAAPDGGSTFVMEFPRA